MKQVGYGKDYRYVHSDPAAKEEMECLPEGLFPLSQATIYLARAPKSNAIKSAYFAAATDGEETA